MHVKTFKPLRGYLAVIVSAVMFHCGVSHAHQGEDHALDDERAAFAARDAEAVEVTAMRVAQTASDRHDIGEWGPLMNWPHIPVTAANLPDGRVLTFASNRVDAFPGGQPEFTYAATWDPATGNFVNVPHNSHDMFCAHTVSMDDGRVFVSGGRNHVNTTSVFNANTNSWSVIDPMNRGRWYPTSVALSDGRVMTSIGSSGGQFPEVWQSGQGWKLLTGINLQAPILNFTGHYEQNWWPYMSVTPRGDVLHYGPTPNMHRLDPAGDGTLTGLGPLGADWYPKHGAPVLYAPGKILVAGGATAGGQQASTNKALLIDMNGPTPLVTTTNSMVHPRKFHNAVMLPTGEVLMVGGNTSGAKFNDAGTVLSGEIWNPDTQQWREVADMSAPRNYHSIALLLTDGRVLSGGGGLCGSCNANHQNAQTYSPPYLFDENGAPAVRPVITSAPNAVQIGRQMSVSASAGIGKWSLIKMSTTTHGVNTDLRYLEVPATGNGPYTLSLPSSPHVLTPGMYMLFAVNNAGVPSIAKVIQVQRGPLTITQPSDRSDGYGDTVSLAIETNEPAGHTLTFSAAGLPLGLSINPNTGVISGRLRAIGSHFITVDIDSSAGVRVSTSFAWQVTSAISGVSYEYYEGTWSALPNFNALTPVKTGVTATFNLGARNRNDNFGFRFSSLLAVDTPGLYTFFTSSDDGSKLFINGTQVVNNDGLHGALEKSGSINLEPGLHDISVTFFELTGAEVLNVSYQGPGVAKQTIGSSVLVASSESGVLNSAPQIIDPGPRQGIVGEVLSLSLVGTDADGDALTFSASGLPPGLNMTASGVISGVPSAVGSFQSTVSAFDGFASSANVSLSWTIGEPAGPAIRPAVSMSLLYEELDSGARVWNVNPDNNSVTVFDALTHAKLAEIAVGNDPRSIAIAPDGDIWVVNRDSATISVIDSSSLSAADEIDLPVASQPFGLVFDDEGAVAYVALQARGVVLSLDPSTGDELDRLSVGPNPRHLSLTPEGDRLLVSRFITPRLPGEDTANPLTQVNGVRLGGEVVVVDTADLSVGSTIVLRHSERPDAENASRGIPNYLGPAVIAPDGMSAWVPSKQDNIKRGALRDGRDLTHDSTVRSISSRINLDTESEDYPARVDHDNGGVASTAAFSPDGEFLFVALEGSREISAIDMADGSERVRFDVGRAPQGVVVSPDGDTLYVHNFMDRSVGVYDVSSLSNGGANVSELSVNDAVASETLSNDVLVGKQHFYDARDGRLAFDSYMSCASCHNDGGEDGRVWDFTGFGEGVRNTISLEGRGGVAQGPLHWSGNFDEVQDFEGQIRRFNGAGLMDDAHFFAGTRDEPLGDTKAGFSADLDALSAYISSLTNFVRSPYRDNDGSLNAEGLAGRDVFEAENCVACHSGAGFTDSALDVRHDIGTLTSASGDRLNATLDGIDTPTLRGVWSSSPYLHDGSAATLADAVAAHNGVSLSSLELAELQAYLLQVDGLEPAPLNPESCAGLIREAEQGDLSGTFTVDTDANASGGQFVHVPDGAGNVWNFGGGPRAEYCFTVAQAGVYRINTRVLANAGNNDSFFVQVDGSPVDGFLWDVRRSGVFVQDYVSDRDAADPVEVSLSAGEHTVSFWLREDGVRLDRIELELTDSEPPPSQCEGLIKEAEDGDLRGDFVVGSDAQASGGEFVHVPDGSGSTGSPNAARSAAYCFTVQQPGEYRVKATTSAADGTSDSFFVRVDGDPTDAYLWDLRRSAGFTDDFVSNRGGDDPVTLTLAAGEHTVTVYLREDGARLDKVELELIEAPEVASCSGLVREAEEGTTSGRFVIGTDTLASGGQFVHVPEGSGSTGSANAADSVAYCFDVTTPGQYRIKAQVYAEDGRSDSFFVRVDGEPASAYLWDFSASSAYVQGYVSNRGVSGAVLVNLSAGEHTVTFYHREDGGRLDKVELEAAP